MPFTSSCSILLHTDPSLFKLCSVQFTQGMAKTDGATPADIRVLEYGGGDKEVAEAWNVLQGEACRDSNTPEFSLFICTIHCPEDLVLPSVCSSKQVGDM